MPKPVYEGLRRDIVSGALGPGTQLTEAALADEFGVSRTPVREALLQLLRDGLVVRDGRGIIVASTSPQEILEIYEVRILLEGAAARWAASRRSELDLGLLKRAQQEMRECPPDPKLQSSANIAFHEQLWLASHNATLSEMLQRISVHIQRYPETTFETPGRWEKGLEEHDQLIAAIEARDEDEADRIAREHMTEARQIRLQMYSRSVGAAR